MLKHSVICGIICLVNILASSVFAAQLSVHVTRDQAGIPHIFAHNDHDAYLMMGYIEAKDRFF